MEIGIFEDTLDIADYFLNLQLKPCTDFVQNV